ncbi:MAG: serine hydrolase domain-containing protein [Jatrophihabitantaceae bacterium]
MGTGALAAATGCYATAADLAAFYSALLPGQHQLLGEDAQRQLRHRQWDVRGVESGYGLGVFLTRIGDRELFGHSGGFPGHITRTLADPDSRVVVSALTNAIDGPAEPLAAGLFRLIDLAESGSHQQAADADRFVGRFGWLWGIQDVAALGGRLYALNPALPNPADDAVPLERIDDSTLKLVGGPGGGSFGELMHFDFAADGSINSVRGVSGMTMRPWQLPALN